MNIASKIPKSMHESVLRTLLNTFPDDELPLLIDVINSEIQRRKDAKK